MQVACQPSWELATERPKIKLNSKDCGFFDGASQLLLCGGHSTSRSRLTDTCSHKMLVLCQEADRQTRLVANAQGVAKQRCHETFSKYFRVFEEAVGAEAESAFERGKAIVISTSNAEKDEFMNQILSLNKRLADEQGLRQNLEILKTLEVEAQTKIATELEAEVKTMRALLEEEAKRYQRPKGKATDNAWRSSFFQPATPNRFNQFAGLPIPQTKGAAAPYVRTPGSFLRAGSGSGCFKAGSGPNTPGAGGANGFNRSLNGTPLTVQKVGEEAVVSPGLQALREKNVALHSGGFRATGIAAKKHVSTKKGQTQQHSQVSPFPKEYKSNVSPQTKTAPKNSRISKDPPGDSMTGPKNVDNNSAASPAIHDSKAGRPLRTRRTRNPPSEHEAAVTQTSKKQNAPRTRGAKARVAKAHSAENASAAAAPEAVNPTNRKLRSGVKADPESSAANNQRVRRTKADKPAEEEVEKGVINDEEMAQNGKVAETGNVTCGGEKGPVVDVETSPDSDKGGNEENQERATNSRISGGKRPRSDIKKEQDLPTRAITTMTRRGLARSNKDNAAGRLKKEPVSEDRSVKVSESLGTAWADDESSGEARTVKKRRVLVNSAAPKESSGTTAAVEVVAEGSTPLKHRLRNRRNNK